MEKCAKINISIRIHAVHREGDNIMDSWIFKIARKICIVAFGADIFIHAIIGASAANGIIKGTLSMVLMLMLLIILSKKDLKHRIGKSRKKRKKFAEQKFQQRSIRNE